MSRKVVTIGADDTLRIVHEIMEIGKVRHLPVVRGGMLVGVVSQRDLFHASLSSLIGIPAPEQNLFLEGVSITEVMSSPAVSVAPSTSVREAVRVMADRKFGCLPVVEEGRLVGIVTETDVLRFCVGLLGTASR
ncbi:MAG: CBS domain-containing protein [Myxococcota bacterium]|nr:CBS domain-containing protein [Myxococcota bacterium]